MAMVRKKQDDKYLEALRELITTGGGNRQCFDCGQKGPTYVNMTIGSFVCTRCSGVLRGITPPHRVKSISMASFTQDEIDFLKAHGNDVCAKTWLGLWDPKRAVHQDQRELMIDKYERKRYYLEPASPLKSLTNATNLKTTVAATSSTSSATATASSANGSQNTNNNNSNSKTQIQLTPPTSQRTTANGLHKTSSTAISRPHHSTTQVQNGFSSSLSSHTTDAFGLHNGLNSSIGSMSTGALSDTSSCASANGFGAEADFVADFGSADIFNATVASSPASSIGSSTTNNGYAKIQPMKVSAAAHQQFMNGHGGGGGGGVNNPTHLQNGNLVSGSNGNTDNFADFDHAPIYNAAVEETPNYQFVRKNAIRKKSTSSLSGSIIRRNERQLKDILEMDSNENSVDYINFNEDDELGGRRTNTTKASSHPEGYRNLFDDFDAFLTLDDNIQQVNAKEFESDYANVDRTEQITNGSKFTPLALAAHATAMAVLGNQSHFNSQNQALETPTKPFTNQWNAWPSANNMTPNTTTALNTARFPNGYLNQHHPYEMMQQQQQQQQQQQHIYASIANFNTSLQNPSHQYFPYSTLSTQLATTTFDTGKTTIPSVATTTTIAPPTKTQTTSMLNKNTINTTNPFRMHLDVNDNYNSINYDNDYNFNNLFNTTNNTTTATDTDFNTNCNDFNFVSNSILSYNFDFFTTATTSYTITTTTATTTTTSIPIQNFHAPTINNNSNNSDKYEENFANKQNSKIVCKNHNQKNVVNDDAENVKNPFLSSSSNLNAHQFSIYQIPTSTSTVASSTFTSSATAAQNPFKPVPSDQSINTLRNSVVDGNANIESSSNCYDNNNYNYYTFLNSNTFNNENFIDAKTDVANNNFYSSATTCNNKNYCYINSNSNPNCNFNSFSNASTNVNANQNQHPNNYHNENYHNNTRNNDNNSWRLPINNNNKYSTTNGFNNINNNSSAPAEDRYAALKDLDEQLRESKAVAAQAASIVTANVVDSGFGNPNANGTVNPFAAHQQTTVVNPFQNSSNNPTQNASQHLFGQMTLIPNGIAAANGLLNTQKTHTANTGFFNYTASGFTNAANTSQLQQPPQQQQQQQQQQHQASLLYPTSIQTGPNGCGFGFGTLQQQIASNGTGLTTNTFNNPFAATGALNSNNPFL